MKISSIINSLKKILTKFYLNKKSEFTRFGAGVGAISAFIFTLNPLAGLSFLFSIFFTIAFIKERSQRGFVFFDSVDAVLSYFTFGTWTLVAAASTVILLLMMPVSISFVGFTT